MSETSPEIEKVPVLLHKILTGGWKDGLALESTGCSFGGPGFNSQHPQGGSQPFITPVPGIQLLILASLHKHGTDIYASMWPHTRVKQHSNNQTTKPFTRHTTCLKEINHWDSQKQDIRCCQGKKAFLPLLQAFTQVIKLH